jgi:elongation factor G
MSHSKNLINILLKLAVTHFEHQNKLVHLLDTPGTPDFMGQALCALDAVETVAIVINAQNGIEITARRMMQWAESRKLCRMIVINKIDAEEP